MKKIFSFFMIFTMFFITGCSSSTTDDLLEDNLDDTQEDTVKLNFFERISLTQEETILVDLISSDALFYKFNANDYSEVSFKTYIVFDGKVEMRPLNFEINSDYMYGYLAIDLSTKSKPVTSYKVYTHNYKSSFSAKQSLDYSDQFSLSSFIGSATFSDDIKDYTNENFFLSVSYSTSSSNYKLEDIITNADKMPSNTFSLVYSVTFS